MIFLYFGLLKVVKLFEAISQKESDFWLNAYPSLNMAGRLDALLIAIGLRFGEEICISRKCPFSIIV